MINSIEEYLEQLKVEMKKCDRAMFQDATSDAENHLTSALTEVAAADPGFDEIEILQDIIKEYEAPG